MTIVFQGHVEKTEIGPEGKTRLTIYGESRVAQAPIVVDIPYAQAKHYLAGNPVNITIYPLKVEGSADGASHDQA